MMMENMKKILLCALTACAVVVAHEKFGFGKVQAAEKAATGKAPQIILSSAPLKEVRGAPSFAPVVKRVAPSVVTIYSSKTVKQDLRNNPFYGDPLFRRFFGGPESDGEQEMPAPRGRNGRRAPQLREQTEQSLGSGVIVSADGYILSNNHVVEGADEVKVALKDSDQEYVAKVIGTDPQTDISVLKIEAKDLKPITITDSDNLQVGDIVLAVGNPFDVGQTVTMCIVSAMGRGRFGIVDYEDFIQTDAAINAGNSGGALVDAEGRLVGINTAIISRSGGNMGIGFAVPINMARHVMDSIIQYGKVTRGYLGIRLAPEISGGMVRRFGLKDRAGALVDDVMPTTPAGKAGIQPGDVVVEFNGRKVPDSRQLRLWVSQTPPETKASFKVVRDGKERTFNVVLGELPTETMTASGRGKAQPAQKSDALNGVEVADIDRAARRQYGIPQNVQGALVTAVDPTSNSAEAGLAAGDVIQEINKHKVKDSQEAVELSEQISGEEEILLRVWSQRGGGGSRYLEVKPEKSKK